MRISRACSVVTMAAVLLCVWKTNLLAQEVPERSWGVYQRFQGSSGDYGQVLKLDTGVTYYVNRHISVGAGVPYYLVRDTIDTDASFNNGIGNAYINLRFALPNAPVRYSSSVQIGAPTGNEEEGFSTGKVTVDWNNNFSVPLDKLTPFANVGVSNTVSDTAFFTRPFSSFGLVAHFQGGAEWPLARILRVAASGYAVVPSGEQTIVSRVSQTDRGRSGRPGRPFETQTEVVGDAELARDHGLSTWLSLYPTGNVGLYAGYTRSIRYDLDSVFFGVGWNFRGF